MAPTWAVPGLFRIEVAPKYRPPTIRRRIKTENLISKAIALHISSNIAREITTEKLQAAACIRRNTVHATNVRSSLYTINFL